MTTDPYADIRARLTAATPGPWQAATSGQVGGDHWYVLNDDGQVLAHIHSDDGTNEATRGPDATLIAHAPADLARLLADVDRVRDLHRPRRLGRGYPGGGTVCTTCRSVASLPVPYPCPTIRALDGEEDDRG